MKKINVCLILIFLVFFLSGCEKDKDTVTFEIERIYITNELSQLEYPVINIEIYLYGNNNKYLILKKVFNYDSDGLAEFSIKNSVDTVNELENIDYLIPNYTSLFSFKNNEILRLHVIMLLLCNGHKMTWDLSSFLKLKGDAEYIVLENQDSDSKNHHFHYPINSYTKTIDNCNINLVTKKHS